MRMMDLCALNGCHESVIGNEGCEGDCRLVLLEDAERERSRVRPRNSAGVATMARLMQRTRDERDFGGVVDDDA